MSIDTISPAETVVAKHPFASARVKQQIFTLESSSDELSSDENKTQTSPHSYSPQTPNQSSLSSQELVNSPHIPARKSLVLQSSRDSSNSTQESVVLDDQLIHGLEPPTLLDEESIEINMSTSHTSNVINRIQTNCIEIHEHITPPQSPDLPMLRNTISLLSKTSTPNQSSLLVNSEIICVDRTPVLDSVDTRYRRSVSISPLIQNPIASSFCDEIPGSNNEKKETVTKTAHENLESTDSENEALRSLSRKRKFQSKRQIISSQFSPPSITRTTQQTNPRKKRKLNYFIDDEAIESDGEYSQDSFQSPTHAENRSLPDSSYTDYSVVSRLIADTSASTTGCNESSMYARYVRDIISPSVPNCRLVIDPKRHRILAAAGKNILK